MGFNLEMDRTSLRDSNLRNEVIKEDSKLDASLKKNTAFVRKLKIITEQNKESLLKEFSCLKFSKYATEAVYSVLENKLKSPPELYAVVEV